MNGKSLAALGAVLTMLAAGLTGCLSGDFLGASSTKSEVSAMENKDLADNAAKAWSPDAKLSGVFGLELLNSTPEGAASDWPTDPHLGNGKAPAWTYVYSAANATRAFRVTADGRVRTENDTRMATDVGDAKPLGDWIIDTPIALKAATANGTFSDAMKGKDLTLAQGVAMMDGITGIYFAAMSEGGMAFATVDAANGKLLSAKSFAMDKMRFPRYAGTGGGMWGRPLHEEGSGTVDAAKPTKEFFFNAQSGTEATFEITVNKQVPTDGYSWSIVDANGEKVKSSSTSNGFRSMQDKSRTNVTLPDAGAYKVIVSYTSPAPPSPAALGSVQFTWKLTSGGMMPGM